MSEVGNIYDTFDQKYSSEVESVESHKPTAEDNRK